MARNKKERRIERLAHTLTGEQQELLELLAHAEIEWENYTRKCYELMAHAKIDWEKYTRSCSGRAWGLRDSRYWPRPRGAYAQVLEDLIKLGLAKPAFHRGSLSGPLPTSLGMHVAERLGYWSYV